MGSTVRPHSRQGHATTPAAVPAPEARWAITRCAIWREERA